MLILALDTTTAHGSLALARDGEPLETRAVDALQNFSRIIFACIQSLLAAHRVTLPDIDLYAAAAGPGSFTGVRVGLAAVKGLAAAHGRRVAPVSNLAAVAWQGAEASGRDNRVYVPVLDARRGEVYAAVYEVARTSVPRRLADEVVVKPAQLAAWLDRAGVGASHVTFCGPEAERFAIVPATTVTTSPAIAGAVARLALSAAQAGETVEPAVVDANYVRRSDAELFSKPWR